MVGIALRKQEHAPSQTPLQCAHAVSGLKAEAWRLKTLVSRDGLIVPGGYGQSRDGYSFAVKLDRVS
jgi:hypothetical protein